MCSTQLFTKPFCKLKSPVDFSQSNTKSSTALKFFKKLETKNSSTPLSISVLNYFTNYDEASKAKKVFEHKIPLQLAARWAFSRTTIKIFYYRSKTNFTSLNFLYKDLLPQFQSRGSPPSTHREASL